MSNRARAWYRVHEEIDDSHRQGKCKRCRQQPPATPEHLDEPPQVVGEAGGLRVERLRQHLLGHDLDSSTNSLALGMTTDRQVSSARTSSSWGCANQVAIPKELSSSRPRLRLR